MFISLVIASDLNTQESAFEISISECSSKSHDEDLLESEYDYNDDLEQAREFGLPYFKW